MTRQHGVSEIVVAGAGPVGLMFAWRLARARAERFRIRIVDAREPVRWRSETVDVRVYALSRESQWLFGGLWAEAVARRVSPYGQMCVFEGDDPAGAASVSFDAADIAEPDLGHIVEDSLLRTVLLDALGQLEVELDFGRSIERLDRERGRMRLGLDDGSEIVADLVVGADGVESGIRAAAGFGQLEKRYRQRAIVSHVTTGQAHGATAWQRFLPEGPLAFLPLADGRSSIVWTSGDAEAGRLLALDDAAFAAALETASAGVLGHIGTCSPRHAFALKLGHACRYSRPGVVLIGDAAHAVHPLAGQGMNLGLRDAAVLADTLATAAGRGEYPADEFVLRRYEREQKAHNLTMQLAFDGLNELFRRPALAWTAPLRHLGMAVVDRSATAKRLLMRRAMGLDSAARPLDPV